MTRPYNQASLAISDSETAYPLPDISETIANILSRMLFSIYRCFLIRTLEYGYSVRIKTFWFSKGIKKLKSCLIKFISYAT
jgi:hypothetical protein